MRRKTHEPAHTTPQPLNPQQQPIMQPEIKLTTSSDLHPQSYKENPETWYSEKNRMSIVHIQTPTDQTTEYYYHDDSIHQKLLTYILFAIILFFIGAFL